MSILTSLESRSLLTDLIRQRFANITLHEVPPIFVAFEDTCDEEKPSINAHDCKIALLNVPVRPLIEKASNCVMTVFSSSPRIVPKNVSAFGVKSRTGLE